MRSSELSLWLTSYLRICGVVGTEMEKQRELYRLHADLYNHVIDVLKGRPALKVPECDLVQFDYIDPFVVRGSMAVVKPDINVHAEVFLFQHHQVPPSTVLTTTTSAGPNVVPHVSSPSLASSSAPMTTFDARFPLKNLKPALPTYVPPIAPF
ncbi:hypothetical protein IW261DRAFT_1481568 [Armillaria novae-zelandiae]|uniref:Uncharacterized protein n=1 Tax=Armillaria novae-zelandiae TaxID=153914 RepID=A0AA39P8L0_9AGAR|nr:hypothetical protein IW261DRAFT_1481568 [Armillaria novae-zelandiae]